MKILITGGAGFLGSYLCEKYVNDGHVVYAIDNLMNGNLNNIRILLHKKNFKFLHDDIRRDELYKNLPTDLDAILHLASKPMIFWQFSYLYLFYDLQAQIQCE